MSKVYTWDRLSCSTCGVAPGEPCLVEFSFLQFGKDCRPIHTSSMTTERVDGRFVSVPKKKRKPKEERNVERADGSNVMVHAKRLATASAVARWNEDVSKTNHHAEESSA